MDLLIIRHGKAEDHSADGSDAARQLTEKGWRQAEAVGNCLRRLDWLPELYLSSPRARALQTARGVMSATGADGEPVLQSWLDFGMSDEEAFAELGAYQACGRIALFGHEPSFSSFVQWLLGADAWIEVKKASLIGLSIESRSRRLVNLHFVIPPKAIL
ncbi:MAG: histidine phosphatase family protein [Verrucomicrobiota bacterium JB023]|nr:histidine phosphatase family protein [Verrucomicrobiota bacterium JB023]